MPGPASLSADRGQGGQQLEGGQIAAHILEPDPPDRDEKQPADNEGDGGRGVVPANDPAVEVGGVIEHQIERRILPGHRERPVEEPPCRAAQTARDQDRIAPFHRTCLRRVSTSLSSGFGNLPVGINWTGATPKGRG